MYVVWRTVKGAALLSALVIALLLSALANAELGMATGGIEGPSGDSYNSGDTGGTGYGQSEKKQKKKKKKRSKESRNNTTKPGSSKKKGPIFPVQGDHTFGEDGAKFGATRGKGKSSYKHQGQDIIAAEGLPVVSPTDGTVRFYKYQADGAGYYLVIDDANSDRDYVFMHLKKGSIEVKAGDSVKSGQQIAKVGTTGSSSGPHLHFEIWDGGWYTGSGKPIDPLSKLKQWDSYS